MNAADGHRTSMASIVRGTSAGFPAITLTSPDGSLAATFLPCLNMLGSSLVHDGEELLHLRAGIATYADRGKTCGIPFLHPWANRLSGDRYEAGGQAVQLSDPARPLPRDANGLPIHGLLGGRTPWEITRESATADAAVLAARFDFARQDLLASFPFPHEIGMRVVLGNGSLAITTSVRPTTSRRVPISFGYHPYFQLPGAARRDWILTLPVRRRLVLDQRGIPTGKTEPVEIEPAPLAERSYDDGFTDIQSPRVFALEGAGRRIEVEMGERYPFAQVYAPRDAQFVCIEPMTAATDALVEGARLGLQLAEPGSLFESTFTIRVRR